ncbi:thiamine pyrophosphate-dependent dehydrogenase E1 component subunit alpha [Homoserinimonas sp. A447]
MTTDAEMASETSTPTELGQVRRDLYRMMILIRGVENGIERSHRSAKIDGSFHSSLGQESCAAGVCSALRLRDIVTSTHRGHGHALAKGVPPEMLMAELFKRVEGTSGGRGASMHLHHRESGFYGETAIVGGGLPWGAGAAWARRRLTGSDDIAVAFAGDGAFAHGVFSETIRTARLWEAPVLFVCENNGWAHSMQAERMFGPPGSIAKSVKAMGIRAEYVDGRDAMAVREASLELVEYVRGGRPAFLECAVYRVRAHSLNDADYRYRAKTDGADWLAANDPVASLRLSLAPQEADKIDSEVAGIVAESIELAESGSHPPIDSIYNHIYTNEELNRRARAEIR